MYIYIYEKKYIHMCICNYIPKKIFKNMCLCTYICIFKCMCIYIYISLYIFKDTYIYTFRGAERTIYSHSIDQLESNEFYVLRLRSQLGLDIVLQV
jgi:hypothetical protein